MFNDMLTVIELSTSGVERDCSTNWAFQLYSKPSATYATALLGSCLMFVSSAVVRIHPRVRPRCRHDIFKQSDLLTVLFSNTSAVKLQCFLRMKIITMAEWAMHMHFIVKDSLQSKAERIRARRLMSLRYRFVFRAELCRWHQFISISFELKPGLRQFIWARISLTLISRSSFLTGSARKDAQ